MIECPMTMGGKKRKRNICNTSTLDIFDVDIIVYDFTLTKAGCLRKSTIDIIKEKLPSLQSGSRSATYNLESHHLVYDEDNALIGTSEDDDEESSLYIVILRKGVVMNVFLAKKCNYLPLVTNRVI